MKKRNPAKMISLLFLAIALLVPSPRDGSTPTVSAQPAPVKAALTLTDRLSENSKEVVVETGEWAAVFSLKYNGGIYRLFDKVNDPDMKDNLLQEHNSCQGGLFGYCLALPGFQLFNTTLGSTPNPGRARLEILENNRVRVRLRQYCHLRLNDGSGPPGDPYVELDMVSAATEWTIYPTGRININFDAVFPEGWTGVVSQGPGGDGQGISTDGLLVTAVNGVDFNSPWVTTGDTIESKNGGWGPITIVKRESKSTIRIGRELPKAEKLDYIIRRANIVAEYIAINNDGSLKRSQTPRESTWQAGTNGVPVFSKKIGDKIWRGQKIPPISEDYVIAQWTQPPRGFGSLIALNELFPEANFALVDDLTYANAGYTNFGRDGQWAFAPVHRHFLVQLGVENGTVTPRIKGIPDALPFADDYRNPYAEARTGALLTGEGISRYGFHVPTGAYWIAAKNKVAAIAFDAARKKTVPSPLAYPAPAVLVTGLDAADDKLAIELSKDNGKTFKPLADSDFLVTTSDQGNQLGGADRRLFLYLRAVPAAAAGKSAWVFRFRQR